MSDDETGLNPEERAQIAGNRRLAGRFIREWIESPERVEPFPYGTSVVLMPPDDPALAAANPALTERGPDGAAPSHGGIADGSPGRRRQRATDHLSLRKRVVES